MPPAKSKHAIKKRKSGKRLTQPKGGHRTTAKTAREQTIVSYSDVMLMMLIDNGFYKAAEVRRVCKKHGRDLSWLKTKRETGEDGDDDVYFCDG